MSVETTTTICLCIEHTYGNKVNVNSVDKIINNFGQRRGSVNVFFLLSLDFTRLRLLVEVTEYAGFQFNFFRIIPVSLDARIVNVFIFHAIWVRLHPDFKVHFIQGFFVISSMADFSCLALLRSCFSKSRASVHRVIWQCQLKYAQLFFLFGSHTRESAIKNSGCDPFNQNDRKFDLKLRFTGGIVDLF